MHILVCISNFWHCTWMVADNVVFKLESSCKHYAWQNRLNVSSHKKWEFLTGSPAVSWLSVNRERREMGALRLEDMGMPDGGESTQPSHYPIIHHKREAKVSKWLIFFFFRCNVTFTYSSVQATYIAWDASYDGFFLPTKGNNYRVNPWLFWRQNLNSKFDIWFERSRKAKHWKSRK